MSVCIVCVPHDVPTYLQLCPFPSTLNLSESQISSRTELPLGTHSFTARNSSWRVFSALYFSFSNIFRSSMTRRHFKTIRLLTIDQKQIRVTTSEQNLTYFNRNPKEFLPPFVTMDETLIHHCTFCQKSTGNRSIKHKLFIIHSKLFYRLQSRPLPK